MSTQDKIAGLNECIADSKAELADAIAAYGAGSPWVSVIKDTIRMAERQLAAIVKPAL